jgi:hypothetical protein
MASYSRRYSIMKSQVSGVHDTAEQWWMVSMTLQTKIDTADQGTSKFSMLWLLLKGIPNRKLYYTISTTFIQKI